MCSPQTYLYNVLAAALISIIGACNSNDDRSSDIIRCDTCKTEEAFPGQAGTAKTMELGGQVIHYLDINGKAVYEGDILLDTSFLFYADSVKPFIGAGIEGRRWPGNTVIYQIDRNLSDSQEVTSAIQHWQAKTPIRFRRKQPGDKNWVTFSPGSGCSSDVGMMSQPQFITLGKDCSYANALHEIGHTVGLFHENSRADRDSFLIVKWNNIPERYKSNFKTYLERGRRGFDDGSFDFNSRMLYEPYSFAIDRDKPTITRKDGSVYRPNFDSLSDGDVQIVQRMYPAD